MHKWMFKWQITNLLSLKVVFRPYLRKNVINWCFDIAKVLFKENKSGFDNKQDTRPNSKIQVSDRGTYIPTGHIKLATSNVQGYD